MLYQHKLVINTFLFQMPHVPHFLRVAKLGAIMKMRIDNMPPATVAIGKELIKI
jgi:hypothetical protein